MLVDRLVQLEMVIVTPQEWMDHLAAVEAVQGSPFNVMSLTHLHQWRS